MKTISYDAPETNPKFNFEIIPEEELSLSEALDLTEAVDINGQDIIIENVDDINSEDAAKNSN